MSVIKYVTLQKIVAHDFRYAPRASYSWSVSLSSLFMKTVFCQTCCIIIFAVAASGPYDRATIGVASPMALPFKLMEYQYCNR